MEALRIVVLVLATLATGHIAGLFYAYTISGMPGLAGTDDRSFVDVMQRINRAILNRWFALGFGGSFVFTLLGVVLYAFADDREPLIPVAAAFVVYTAQLVITRLINVPLNNELEAAGPVESISDVAAVRQRFEARWVRWNAIRTVVSTVAFGCMCWALLAA